LPFLLINRRATIARPTVGPTGQKNRNGGAIDSDSMKWSSWHRLARSRVIRVRWPKLTRIFPEMQGLA